MGLETVYIVIAVGTCGDSLPITKPDRLKDHLLATLSKFEAEEYGKGEPHIWEPETISFGFPSQFLDGCVAMPQEDIILYDLSAIMAEEHERLQNEGGQHELVGETGLD
jgi:hypothetical protein